MAQAIACDLCGQETAVLMQTNIENGDVIAIGGSCMVTFLLSTAATILDEMPADRRGAYAEIIKPVTDQLSVHVAAAAAADLEAAAAGGPGTAASAPADAAAADEPTESAAGAVAAPETAGEAV